MEERPPEIVIYRTEDGRTKISVRFESDTVWVTQKKMAELFGVTVSAINQHLKNIFETGELQEKAVIKNFLITAFSCNSPVSKIFLRC